MIAKASREIAMIAKASCCDSNITTASAAINCNYVDVKLLLCKLRQVIILFHSQSVIHLLGLIKVYLNGWAPVGTGLTCKASGVSAILALRVALPQL